MLLLHDGAILVQEINNSRRGLQIIHKHVLKNNYIRPVKPIQGRDTLLSYEWHMK